jgi:hypothetical protein
MKRGAGRQITKDDAESDEEQSTAEVNLRVVHLPFHVCFVLDTGALLSLFLHSGRVERGVSG